MGAYCIRLKIDFQLVVSYIRVDAQAKDLLLQQYLKLARKKLARFKTDEDTHVPREENTRAYVLSRLESTISHEINHSLIRETMKVQSIEVLGDMMAVIHNTNKPFWISSISEYIELEIFPVNPTKFVAVRIRFISYTLIKGTLYRRGFSTPLLRFMGKEEDV